jgi:hypothetical protein
MERTVGAHSINLLFTSIFVEFPFCAGAYAAVGLTFLYDFLQSLSARGSARLSV